MLHSVILWVPHKILSRLYFEIEIQGLLMLLREWEKACSASVFTLCTCMCVCWTACVAYGSLLSSCTSMLWNLLGGGLAVQVYVMWREHNALYSGLPPLHHPPPWGKVVEIINITPQTEICVNPFSVRKEKKICACISSWGDLCSWWDI